MPNNKPSKVETKANAQTRSLLVTDRMVIFCESAVSLLTFCCSYCLLASILLISSSFIVLLVGGIFNVLKSPHIFGVNCTSLHARCSQDTFTELCSTVDDSSRASFSGETVGELRFRRLHAFARTERRVAEFLFLFKLTGACMLTLYLSFDIIASATDVTLE